jgi:5-formyltetrahydrofolate cyclo-ligase
MNAESIEDAKAALRLKARAARSALSEAARAEAAVEAARHFFTGVPLREDEVVAFYWPIREELDVRPLLGQLVDRGQPVCLPVVRGDDQPLDMRLWEAGTPLYPAGFGTLAPAEDAPRVLPHIVIMPLLGFDAAGTRLGYGGGYYDRTLAALEPAPRIVGLAFAAQELAHIPRAPHDRPLDAVVTENGVRHFARAGTSVVRLP